MVSKKYSGFFRDQEPKDLRPRKGDAVQGEFLSLKKDDLAV